MHIYLGVSQVSYLTQLSDCQFLYVPVIVLWYISRMDLSACDILFQTLDLSLGF